MYCKGIFSEVGDWILFGQDFTHWLAAVVELCITGNAGKFLKITKLNSTRLKVKTQLHYIYIYTYIYIYIADDGNS